MQDVMLSRTLDLALLERALFEEPTAFDFFQAVHLLERLQPERTPLGGFGDPGQEVVRIGVNPRLGFPASEIQALEATDGMRHAGGSGNPLATTARDSRSRENDGEGGRPRMTVNFTGLTGPSGVLPYPYATLLLERLAARDAALGAFFDLFHHRIASLFYAAWEKHRFTLRYAKEGMDLLTHHLRDLAGLGLDGEKQIGPVTAESLTAYVGLLGPTPRSAIALEQLLADHFDVPCRVEQFVGGWYPVSVDDGCLLDEPTPASVLGQGALVGDEVWDPQGAVRVQVGPLTQDEFDAFLPTGGAYEMLQTLLYLFSHGQYEFEVQLVLAREEVAGVILGDATAVERLGWTSWIATQPRAADADDTVLRVHA